jgi:hypothetical protein
VKVVWKTIASSWSVWPSPWVFYVFLALSSGLLGCQPSASTGADPQLKEASGRELVFALQDPDSNARCFYTTNTRSDQPEFVALNKAPLGPAARVEASQTPPSSEVPLLDLFWGSEEASRSPLGAQFAALSAEEAPRRLSSELRQLERDGHVGEVSGACPEILTNYLGPGDFPMDNEGLALTQSAWRRWMLHGLFCVACALNSYGQDLGEPIRRRFHRPHGIAPAVKVVD